MPGVRLYLTTDPSPISTRGLGLYAPVPTAASSAGVGVLLLENGFNLLLENGQAVLEG